MKKLTSFIAALVITGSFSVFSLNAQEEAPSKQNVVKLSISNLIVVTPTLFYERVLNEKSSIQGGAFFTGFTAGDTRFSGIAIMPEYRLYPGSKNAPNGFFLAPFIKYQNFTLKADEISDIDGNTYEAKASLNGIGGGVVIGSQWLVGNAFVIDTYIGPSLNNWSTSYKDNSSSEDFDFSIFNSSGVGFGVRFGVSLGFAF
jgi:hypothetical protein